MSHRLTIALLLIVVSGSALATPLQTEGFRGPILGFTPNSVGSVIWPILGIAGASRLGDRLVLDTEIHGAIISPKQDYALAVRIADARPVLIHLADDPPATSAVLSMDIAADLFGISTTGSAAAIYNNDSKLIRVIGGLPDAAEQIYQFDVSDLPGSLNQISLSDDGTIVLVKFTAAEGDFRFRGYDSSGATWDLPVGRPSAAVFFANSHDAAVTDDSTQTVFVIGDLARTAVQLPLVSAVGILNGFSAVAVSADNQQVFAADANTGKVMIIDVETHTFVPVSCDCLLSGLARLTGNSMFRLNEVSREALKVLDASSGEPRIVVTPPKSFARRTQR